MSTLRSIYVGRFNIRIIGSGINIIIWVIVDIIGLIISEIGIIEIATTDKKRGKKAKKIVLNQLNEITIQWLHLTAG